MPKILRIRGVLLVFYSDIYSRFRRFYIFPKLPLKAAILSFFSKEPLFPLVGRRKMNLGRFLETYVGFLNKYCFATFLKILPKLY